MNSKSRSNSVVLVVLVLLAGVGGVVFYFGSRPSESELSNGIQGESTKTDLSGNVDSLLERAGHELPLRAALEKSIFRVKSHPELADAWGRLGMLCQGNGLLAEARELYLIAENFDAADSLWPHLRGGVCERLSLPDEALAAYKRSMEMEPHDIVARCSVARIYQDRGENEKARLLYLEVTGLDPKCVAARVGMAQLALRSDALEIAKKSALLALSYHPSCGPAHSVLAQVYGKQDNAAQSDFHRRWSLITGGRLPLPDPYVEEVEALGVTYTARMNRGELAVKRGRWREAVDHFRAALELQSELVEPRYYLGLALLNSGDVEPGLEELAKVCAQEGRQIDAWIHIARVHATRGDLDKAHEALAAALKVDPESAKALVAQGNLYRREKKRELALAAYDRAIAAHADHAEAYLEKGRLLQARTVKPEEAQNDDSLLEAERERAEAALAASERALELKVDLPVAYVGAGSAHMQVREFSRDETERDAHLEAAITIFGRMVTCFPDQKRAHTALIRALHAAGRDKETQAAVKKAAERWPDDPQFHPIWTPR